MLSEEQKQQKRQEKKERIIRIRKTLSEMSEEQHQAVADKFGIVTVEGHLLTAYNQCFLVAQLASLDASRSGSEINFTVVGGFQHLPRLASGKAGWKKAGRIVRKGEHGFLILVPSKTNSEENSEMISDDEDVKFFSATVFDISQTEVIAKSEAA